MKTNPPVAAKRTVTEVLFFSSSDDSAELKQAQSGLSMSNDRLLASSEAIAGRVRPFVADSVKNIEI